MIGPGASLADTVLHETGERRKARYGRIDPPLEELSLEYDLPFEEYGWQHVIINDEGDDQIWDVDNPVVATADPDHGITYGLPDDGTADERS